MGIPPFELARSPKPPENDIELLRLEAYRVTMREVARINDEEIANFLGIEKSDVCMEHRWQVEARITAARIDYLESEIGSVNIREPI